MFKRIDHVEVMPSDTKRAITFYTEVLGFTLKERFPVNMPPLVEVVFLTLGDTMLEILGPTTPDTTPLTPAQVAYRALALEVEDMAKAIEYLTAKGYPAVWGPMNLGDSIRAEIRDPDGLPIELREWL